MSQHMGVGPYQPLDLYDPDVLANAMNGIIKGNRLSASPMKK